MRRGAAEAALFLIALAALAPYLADPPAAGVAVQLAYSYAAGRWGLAWQPDSGGGSPVWTLGPPGLPALAAALSKAGVRVETAAAWLAAILSGLGAAAVYRLTRQWKWPALWIGAAFAAAPWRWAELTREGQALHAVAVSIVPVTGLLLARRRASLALAGTLLFAAFYVPWPGGSILPELELLMLLAGGWLAVRTGRRHPAVISAALFAAGWAWVAVSARLEPVTAVRAETIDWLKAHAPGEIVLGPHATPRQAERVILGPGNIGYSVLWLQALGASHFLSRDMQKYAAALESEYEDAGGYRVFSIPVRHPGRAVLVSRYQWRNLPALRSVYDRPALAAYVEWANRPEGAGFRWLSGREAEVQAEVGPDDMILVRQNAGTGWSARIAGEPAVTHADPIGFLLLDPERTGPVTIRLRTPWRAGAPAQFSEHAVPAIDPGGIVDGVRLTPPPFRPGAVVTIYGSGLGQTGATRVLVAGQEAEVLYAAEAQVNARLPRELDPGAVEVTVEVRGTRSNAVSVEIGR
jgi:hypothetical protein